MMHSKSSSNVPFSSPLPIVLVATIADGDASNNKSEKISTTLGIIAFEVHALPTLSPPPLPTKEDAIGGLVRALAILALLLLS